MEELRVLEPLFKNTLFQFFLYMALIQLLAQVFFDRRVAFLLSSISTTVIWLKSFDKATVLKAWLVILSVFLLYLVPKVLLRFNLFLYLQGKKRCPQCYSEVHRKAKVCPYCNHSFEERDV